MDHPRKQGMSRAMSAIMAAAALGTVSARPERGPAGTRPDQPFVRRGYYDPGSDPAPRKPIAGRLTDSKPGSETRQQRRARERVEKKAAKRRTR